MARIEVPLPFALASANCWLLAGREPLLVDCGIRTPAAYQALQEGLRRHGAAAAGLRLVVTHGHVDHAGNAAALGRDHGARLAAPRAEAEYIETFRRDGARRNGEFGAALLAHGVPRDVAAAVRERSDAMDAYGEDAPIAHALAEGTRLPVGDAGAHATVRMAPGHTPGSLLLERDDLLVTGDTLLEHITSNAIELRDADRGRYRTYLRTLEGLRRYVGMTALPGHHAPFRLTDALLDGHLAKHMRRRERVRAALDVPRTAWEMLPRVLPHLAQDQVFLGMCEVVGHLHALEADGLVRETVDAAGTRRFLA